MKGQLEALQGCLSLDPVSYLDRMDGMWCDYCAQLLTIRQVRGCFCVVYARVRACVCVCVCVCCVCQVSMLVSNQGHFPVLSPSPLQCLECKADCGGSGCVHHHPRPHTQLNKPLPAYQTIISARSAMG